MERKQKQKVKTVASLLNSKTISIFYFRRKSDLQKLIFCIRIQRSWNIQTVKGFLVSFSLKGKTSFKKHFLAKFPGANGLIRTHHQRNQTDIQSAVSLILIINSKLPLMNNKVEEEINKNNDSHLLEPSPGAIPSVWNNNCQK